MKRLSYIACCAIAVLVLSSPLSSPAAAAVPHAAFPAASYLVQINGHTFLEREPNRRLAPASLTKIMTALIVIEKCRMDEVVTVSRGAALETGSRIGLRRGERLTVHDLLAATLIASGNDACRALADHVGGSQKAFVGLMNAKAKTLHLENTRFTNACGHDNASLYTSAHDLAILAEHALRNPVFASLVSQPNMRISTVKGRRSYWFRNKNRLIGRYPGAAGVKTGTTPNAGQCLVALAKRGDTRVLLVLMRSRNRWRAAPAMLDAAFASRHTAMPTAPAVMDAAFATHSSAMRDDKGKGGGDEAPPEGAVVRDQEEAGAGEHNR